MRRRLVIDGNAVYEVDEECMKERLQKCENLTQKYKKESSRKEKRQNTRAQKI